MYAKQLAWLHSAPKLNDKQENPKSRMEILSDDHPSKTVPFIDKHIENCFSATGRCMSGGMSPSEITWNEISSFNINSGYRLNGWESEQIIMMSRAYCNFLHKASKISCPAPYSDGLSSEEEIDEMRKRVDSQLDSIWAALLP